MQDKEGVAAASLQPVKRKRASAPRKVKKNSDRRNGVLLAVAIGLSVANMFLPASVSSALKSVVTEWSATK